MKRLLNLITLIVLPLLHGVSASAQKFRSEDVLACFEQFFVKENFDSIYFNHKNAKPGSFFVILEGTEAEIFNGFPKDQKVFELNNGNLLSLNSKGRMFVWGIEYYLRLSQAVFTHNECHLTIEGIDFNGFTEKVLKKERMRFIKEKDNWVRDLDAKSKP